MASDVSAGQAEVYRQFEQQSMEQTVQASRLDFAARIANEKVGFLEAVLQETKRESDEANLLLASSVSAVYSLENEAVTLQMFVRTQSEEMSHASMMNEELKTSWNQISEIYVMLRSQIISVEKKSAFGQQDSSMRPPDDESLRDELSASLARESVWKNERYMTKIEVQHYVRELSAQRQISADELCLMREEYLRSTNAYNEARAVFQTSRSRFEAAENQATMWKEECRMICVRGCERERKFEGEFSVVRSEMETMAYEMSTLRFETMMPEDDPSLLLKFRALEKERDGLRASLKAAEEQLGALRREVIVLTQKASSVNLDRYMLKSDHVNALKKREE